MKCSPQQEKKSAIIVYVWDGMKYSREQRRSAGVLKELSPQRRISKTFQLYAGTDQELPPFKSTVGYPLFCNKLFYFCHTLMHKKCFSFCPSFGTSSISQMINFTVTFISNSINMLYIVSYLMCQLLTVNTLSRCVCCWQPALSLITSNNDDFDIFEYFFKFQLKIVKNKEKTLTLHPSRCFSIVSCLVKIISPERGQAEV